MKGTPATDFPADPSRCEMTIHIGTDCSSSNGPFVAEFRQDLHCPTYPYL